MLQIVHDVAPGAALGFATAEGGDLAFANNIEALADTFGAKIIADDIVYFDEPYFQEGPIGQAIDTVTGEGVTYFSAAGNFGSQAYESSNVSFMNDTIAGISGSPGSYYNFNPTGTATDKQQITMTAGQQIDFGLQWDQPFYTTNGVTTDLNFYLLNDTTGAVVASSTTDNVATQTPLQLLSYTNSTGATATYDVVIQNAVIPAGDPGAGTVGTTPGVIKYVNFGSNDFGDVIFDNFATNSPTIVPHAADPENMAVGAAPAVEQRTPETFTALGPATFLFDAAGDRLTTPEVVDKPNIMSIDGVSTTFFGETTNEYNGKPVFFGTSAATPGAAGVAALVLQANPTFTPAQIDARLESTADPDISATAGDFNDITTGDPDIVGAGLIDAYRAVFPTAPVVATPNFTDNFASGALGSDWEVYNNGAGRTQVTTANGPDTGDTYDLTMDGSADGWGFPVQNEAILNVNATNYTDLTLSFNQKSIDSFGDPMNPLPSTSFTGHVDGDGVSLSVDGGNTWFPLISLTGANTSSSYQTDTLNLSTFAATNGLTLGSDVQIKFQQYDQNSFHYNGPPGFQEGFVFDDVSVSGSDLPSITSISPSSGPTAGGTSVTINGSRFTGATDVNFGSSDIKAANFTVVNDGEITLTDPAGSAGTVHVTVTTAGGTSNAGTFTYVAVPTVTSLSPPSGPTAGGTAVTINGSGFTGATDVNFGSSDIKAANFTVNGAGTQIMLTDPAGSAGRRERDRHDGGRRQQRRHVHLRGGPNRIDRRAEFGSERWRHGGDDHRQRLHRRHGCQLRQQRYQGRELHGQQRRHADHAQRSGRVGRRCERDRHHGGRRQQRRHVHLHRGVDGDEPFASKRSDRWRHGGDDHRQRLHRRHRRQLWQQRYQGRELHGQQRRHADHAQRSGRVGRRCERNRHHGGRHQQRRHIHLCCGAKRTDRRAEFGSDRWRHTRDDHRQRLHRRDGR